MYVYLVFLDLKPTSLNALGYAALLAQSTKSEILICHHLNLDESVDEDLDPIVENKKKAEATEELHRISHFANPKNELSFHYHVFTELDDKGFEQLILDNNISMVLAGLDTGSNLEKWLFGSSVFDLIEVCICPVLIIPDKAELKTPSKLLILTHDIKELHEQTQKIEKCELPALTKTYLNINSEKSEAEKTSTSLLSRIAGDVKTGFESALKEFKPDLVCLSPRKDTDRPVFSKSFTRSVLQTALIPTLILTECTEL
jgi:hypothetical protein